LAFALTKSFAPASQAVRQILWLGSNEDYA
jgi:hypothetical protein